MSDIDFSRERLERILSAGRKAGVVFRHDVDFDLYCATQMAGLEHELGVRATYYLLTDAEGYDVFDERESVGEILSFGHDIGVHVDLKQPRQATVTIGEMRHACIDAYRLLKDFYPHTTTRISFHQPPKAVLGIDVPGFQSAQDSYWTSRQISDSRGVWRTHPETLIAAGGPLQINLHPEWWFLSPPAAEQLRKQEAVKP